MSLVLGCSRNKGQGDTRLLWRGPGHCLEYDKRGYSWLKDQIRQIVASKT